MDATDRLLPMLLTAGVAAVLLVSGACGDGDITGVPPGAIRVPAERVDTAIRESSTGVTDRRRLVIRSESEWTRFVEEVYARRSPRPDPPAIDFEENMVIAVSMGERPSGGYAIEIDAIHRAGEQLYVQVDEIAPGPSCATIAVLTQPVLAVEVPRVSGSVAFIEHESVHDCT